MIEMAKNGNVKMKVKVMKKVIFNMWLTLTSQNVHIYRKFGSAISPGTFGRGYTNIPLWIYPYMGMECRKFVGVLESKKQLRKWPHFMVVVKVLSGLWPAYKL